MRQELFALLTVSVVSVAAVFRPVPLAAQDAAPGEEHARTPVAARASVPEDFRYERYARPERVGPNRLPVDLPLLTGASPFLAIARLSSDGQDAYVAQAGLADLRFFDQAGREVPYLLVAPAPRLPDYVRGRILPVAATKKTSGFEVDLGAPVLVDRVRVQGLPSPYLKRVRLEASGDRARWTVLAPETTLFDLPAEHLSRQEIEFPAGAYRYVRLTWDDASSARMPPPRACDARRVPRMAARADLRAPVAFERRASEPGVSRYRLALPAPRLPVIAVELAVAGGNVLRRARITESRLDGGQMNPVTLGESTLRRTVREDAAAADMRIPIQPPREGQLDLVVEDGSNPPLDLTGVNLVFADLPWIYFEAASTEAILARFGAARASAPRYDLEAMRPSLGRLDISQATWGERLDLEPRASRAAESAVPMVGATLDESPFRFRRGIPAGPAGLTALRLDAAALAHSRFADLRIATPDARQVPYLLERLDEPLTVALGALEPASVPRLDAELPHASGSRSVYRLLLPYESLPAARLVLTTPARVFTREVRLVAESRHDGGRDPRFEVLASSTWRHAEPETPTPPLTLDLQSGPSATWLVVDEGDNSRLPLDRPTLLLPAYRLRFFRGPGPELTLLYGAPGVAAPRYDLALLEPRLVGAAAHEVWPRPEAGATPSSSRAITPTRLFWGALIGAVVILVVVLGRLVRA